MSSRKAVSKQKSDLTKLGDRYKNKVDQWATVVKYVNSTNVTIVFDEYPNHTQVYHSGVLRRGEFKNKLDPMNMLNKRFKNNSGQWVTVIEYRGATEIIVKFDDGVLSTTATSYLKNGSFNHPERFTSMVGKRFESNKGDWCTVLEYINAHKVVIKFDGYEHYEKTVSAKALKEGSFRNNYRPTTQGLGYMGDGIYSWNGDEDVQKAYQVFTGMFSRCYDPYTQSKQPAYIGCSVDARWYDFQVFAKFYVESPFCSLGYHLDKDLLIRGNRVYSPEACTLLPPEVNSALSSTPESASGLPLGVNKIDNGYVARLNKMGQNREYLGYYKTAEEAHKVYVKAKEDYIHSLAEKWHGKIEERAYQALMNWTVYP